MVPFESLGTVSYLHSILWLYLVLFPRKRDIGRIRDLFIPLAFKRPRYTAVPDVEFYLYPTVSSLQP